VATVLAFAANVTPASLPFAGAECAPAGLPVEGSFLSQSFTGYHSGIDLVVPSLTAVHATQTGVVVWADWNVFGYGNLVIVQSGRFITYYAHNTSFNVAKGDVIAKGAIVSFSGSTGHSSGPHVHYETRIDDIPVDPLTFESRGFPTC
jgi:murein DD-endopeptidase MepM/ murein hydrolase activator NlpD